MDLEVFKCKDLTISEWLLCYISINYTWETRFVHTYLLDKGTSSDSCNLIWMSYIFCKKLDIQMILQLCGCLSATNACKHTHFSCALLCLCNTTVIPVRSVFEFKDLYSYFHLSENKTINVFPVDYIVQLSKLMSQWANKYLTLRFNK